MRTRLLAMALVVLAGGEAGQRFGWGLGNGAGVGAGFGEGLGGGFGGGRAFDRPAGKPVGSGSGDAIFEFDEGEIKFKLAKLTALLRDRGHEGWVLYAYPDPRTKRPLIGAGFSLDVQAVPHAQLDLLNPHQFLEPSSAQLWEAAGLEPGRLTGILGRFEREREVVPLRKARRRRRAHAADVTGEEAERLLRISAIQAVYNARAYCRGFNQLNGAQQMALSQLVFQMGINLETFVSFLSVLNGDVAGAGNEFGLGSGLPVEDRWGAVQAALIDSQWARLYSDRASSVIAMFDPNYGDDPRRAELRVRSVLMPVPVAGRRRAGGSVREVAYGRRGARSHRKGGGGRRRRG